MQNSRSHSSSSDRSVLGPEYRSRSGLRSKLISFLYPSPTAAFYRVETIFYFGAAPFMQTFINQVSPSFSGRAVSAVPALHSVLNHHHLRQPAAAAISGPRKGALPKQPFFPQPQPPPSQRRPLRPVQPIMEWRGTLYYNNFQKPPPPPST